jgi:hypothetical protein
VEINFIAVKQVTLFVREMQTWNEDKDGVISAAAIID